MNILYVTNMYPIERDEYYGIFVKEQIEAYKKEYPNDSVSINIIDGKENKINYIKSFFSIHSLCKKNKFDIIHIHYGISGIFLLNPFFRTKAKVILTLHGGDILISQKKRIQVYITKIILKKIDFAIILNKEMLNIISKYMPDSKYINLPCGVDTDTFYFKKTNITKKIILFPSSPKRWVKNYPLYKEVINTLRTNYDLDVCEAYIENLSRKEVAILMNESSCLLMTSFSEGSPQSTKEALSCGLPIVSVNVGDIETQIENIPYCKVCTNDVLDLSSAVYNCLNADRKMIREHFLKNKTNLTNIFIIRSIHNIYKSLTKI